MAARSDTAGGGRLVRVVGVPGAVLMGLGSILGTGVFVSLGLAAGIAGPAVVLAAVLAAATAAGGLAAAGLASAGAPAAASPCCRCVSRAA